MPSKKKKAKKPAAAEVPYGATTAVDMPANIEKIDKVLEFYPQLGREKALMLLASNDYDVERTLSAYDQGNHDDDWSTQETRKTTRKSENSGAKKNRNSSGHKEENAKKEKSVTDPKAMSAPSEPQSSVNVTMNVATEYIPALIGKGGSKVKELEATTGASLKISKEANTVTVKGEPDEVFAAMTLINKILNAPKPETKKVDAKKLVQSGTTSTSSAGNAISGGDDGVKTLSAREREKAALQSRGIAVSKSGMPQIDLGQLMASSQQLLQAGRAAAVPKAMASSQPISVPASTFGAPMPATSALPSTKPAFPTGKIPGLDEAVKSWGALERLMSSKWDIAKKKSDAAFRQLETELMTRRGEVERAIVAAELKERSLLSGRMDLLKNVSSGDPNDSTAQAMVTQFNTAMKADLPSWGQDRVSFDVLTTIGAIKSFGNVTSVASEASKSSQQNTLAKPKQPTANGNAPTSKVGAGKPNSAPNQKTTNPKPQRVRRPVRSKHSDNASASNT